jgi:uncharacterized phiE125 gp8 family phage protein
MRLELLTPPVTEPVTLAEVKTRLRIDDATDDAGVTRLIASATKHAESITRRAFVTQSWALTLDAFPCGSISLPLPPLQTVDEISYIDSTGATVVLPSTEYLVDKNGMIGMIHRAYQKQWPATRAQPMAVRIKFTAGYGAAGAVPSDLASALMLLVAHWDQNREPVVIGTIVSSVPLSVESLLAPFVIPGVV